jgi:replicative DNA helicase
LGYELNEFGEDHRKRLPESSGGDSVKNQLLSIEAEQCVIGSLLYDPSAFDRIEDLRAEDFGNAAHAAIFDAARSLFLRGDAFDVVTVSELLKARGKLDFVGGLAYVGAMASAVPTSANVHRYASIVANKARLRALSALGLQAVELANDPSAHADEALADVAAKLGALSDDSKTGGLVSLGKAVAATLDRAQDAKKTSLASVLPSDRLERIMGRSAPGNLIIVAARPSVGKTVFGLQAALMTARRGHSSAFFSLEMTSEELSQRALAAYSGVSLSDIREGNTDSNSEALANALCRLDALPMMIDDTGGLHVDQVRARARAMHRRNPLTLVVIDYLTLLKGSGDNRTGEIGYVSRSLKAMAKELGCVVIALSQLSRKCEERIDKRPELSDLRDSGEIEQDADAVIVLYRDELYNADSEREGIIEMIVRKNRHGALGAAFASAEFANSRMVDVPSGWQAPSRAQSKVVNARARFGADGSF